jgi:hypothetical protein
VSFSGSAHNDIAGLGASVPHPFYFNDSAVGGSATDTLQRTEGVMHIQAVGVADISPQLRVKVFGGPSYFRVKQDMVRAISYDQTYNLLGFNQIDVTGFRQETVDENAWGLHAGGSFEYFFSRVIGIGGTARLSHATVKLDHEPLSGEPGELKAGGFQYGAGLRFRF